MHQPYTPANGATMPHQASYNPVPQSQQQQSSGQANHNQQATELYNQGTIKAIKHIPHNLHKLGPNKREVHTPISKAKGSYHTIKRQIHKTLYKE